MKVKLLLLLPIAILALAGCAKRTLVGSWDFQYNNVPATIEFKQDGTFQADATVGNAHGTISGIYNLDGQKIDAKVQGVDLKNVPEIFAAKIKDGAKKSLTFNDEIEWISDDEVRLKNHPDFSMHRQKKSS